MINELRYGTVPLYVPISVYMYTCILTKEGGFAMAVVNPNLVWVAKLSLNVSAKISGLRHPGADMLFSSEQLDPHASTGTSYTLLYFATVINHPFNEREPVPPPRCHVLPCNTRVRYCIMPHSNQY